MNNAHLQGINNNFSLQIAFIHKIMFNKLMDNDDKVINLFSKKTKAEKKFFAGFEYTRYDKDFNGNPFVEQNLLEYANSCHYIVRVMKERNGEISLYNYDVPSEKLYEFVDKFYKNELQGKIIEIEKYIPDGLA